MKFLLFQAALTPTYDPSRSCRITATRCIIFSVYRDCPCSLFGSTTTSTTISSSSSTPSCGAAGDSCSTDADCCTTCNSGGMPPTCN